MESYPPPPNRIQPATPSAWRPGLAIVFGAAIGLAFLLGTKADDLFAQVQRPEPRPRPVAAAAPLRSDERTTIELFREAAPSAVYITSITARRDFFTLNVFKVPAGSGSGFIWDEDGHIVTNYHVVANAIEFEVTLADQSTWEAEVVGFEPDKDLAVLKIGAPKEQLRPLAVGTSADLQVGQSVLAIGNPFGFDQTLTTGVISGLGREIESMTRRPITGVIQTDAAINPGNSGGPLLDSSGRLIGMNTAIFSPTGTSAGIGFAVPVDTIQRLVPEIIAYGHAIKPTLGFDALDDSLARRNNIKGIVVARVIPGSGADAAGIRGITRSRSGLLLGDVIVAVDGEPVTDNNELYRALDGKKPGQKVPVTLLRKGEKVEVEVSLSEAAPRAR
ncbi:MAG: trypsin-like peptidase domain-containing protein [Verrucomicrobiales bacterium]